MQTHERIPLSLPEKETHFKMRVCTLYTVQTKHYHLCHLHRLNRNIKKMPFFFSISLPSPFAYVILCGFINTCIIFFFFFLIAIKLQFRIEFANTFTFLFIKLKVLVFVFRKINAHFILFATENGNPLILEDMKNSWIERELFFSFHKSGSGGDGDKKTYFECVVCWKFAEMCKHIDSSDICMCACVSINKQIERARKQNKNKRKSQKIAATVEQ